jgi:hypothetical protein
MKDLKLPIISKEEREVIWNNLKEGDTLVEIEWNSWGDSYTVRNRKIIKRTAKGSIRLDNNELLKHLESKYYVVTDELKTWYNIIEVEENLFTLFNKASRDKKYFKNNLTYEDIFNLKEILERALQGKECE